MKKKIFFSNYTIFKVVKNKLEKNLDCQINSFC